MKIQVELKVLDPRMQEQLPAYGTPGSAGIALSLIGAPFFLWLLLRLRRGGGMGLT